MNTILKIKIQMLFIVMVILSSARVYGFGDKSPSDTTFRLTLQLSGGLSRNVSVIENEPDNYERSGISFNLRAMWEPNRLLSVGLETGFVPVSAAESQVDNTFGRTTAKARLTAVPLLGVISMQILGVDVFLGSGFYELISYTEAFGDKTIATEMVSGYYFGFAYSFPVFSDLEFGGELKWFQISGKDRAVAALQLKLIYSLFEY